jgi:hypothetical protein
MTMTTTQATNETAAKTKRTGGRDARGRFTKGNAGGPGNPFAFQVATLRTELIRKVTKKTIGKVADALIAKAVAGELLAIKLLFLYVLGKPAETVDPDRIGFDEWQKFKEMAIDPAEMAEVLERCPAPLAGVMVQKFWGRKVNQDFSDALKEEAELQAIVAEDERYMEEMEKKEEEALRQKAAAPEQAGAEPQAAPAPAAEAPSPKRETAAAAPARASASSCRREGRGKGKGTGTLETCPTGAPSPIGFPAFDKRNGWLDFVGRVGVAEAARAFGDRLRPSPNGERTDGDGSP